MAGSPRRGLRAPLFVVLAVVLAVAAVVMSASATREARAPNPAPAGVAAPQSQQMASLHSSRTQPFLDQAQKPRHLRGVNVVPVWADNPGATWELDRYQQIAAKGFTVVRFVLYWDDIEATRGHFDATALATLDRAIANAKAAGLYVILDEIHLWGTGGFADVPRWARRGDALTSVVTNAEGYLRTLALRYREEPAVAAYDPVNEPRLLPLDQGRVLSAYARLITAIREVDSEKIVLVEPAHGDSLVSPADLSRLSGMRNVVWSPHLYYAGGDDDGYGEDGRQAGNYTWDGVSGYDPADQAALQRHLLVHLDAAGAAGIPVWVGEIGIGSGARNAGAWIVDMVALLGRYGVEFAWWEYHTANAFSATDAAFGWRPWVDVLVTGVSSAPPSPSMAL